MKSAQNSQLLMNLLQYLNLRLPKPQGNQVLVKVKSVGVCHSDLHLWEGGYDLGDGQIYESY